MLKNMIAAAITVFGAAPAFAHASLEATEAHVASSHNVVIRIPHGCEGQPTITVRVQIPEGVISAKPMPKPGWTIEKVRGSYENSYEYHGTSVTEGVKEIAWKGGSLADDEYDEFVVRAFLTEGLPVGEMLYFPIVQECPGGVAERWIEIPAAGQSSDDLEFPAPGIMLLEQLHGH